MDEAERIALSAIEHWSYCPRQCCLIHAEQAFAENLHTLRGQAVHQRVDQQGVEAGYDGRRVARALPLWSERLGLVGKADVVEFLADGTPYPVEYKHGKKRARRHDDLQLAAQALCLEEMTGHAVPHGAIYHASSHRRREVSISADLRDEVAATVVAIRAALGAPKLPPPAADERCRQCSLNELCQPDVISRRERRTGLLDNLFVPDEE